MTPIELLLVAVISLLVHEWAHGLTAGLLGDSVTRWTGRTFPNPFVHLHWFGSFLLPALFAAIGVPPVGWGVPLRFAEWFRGPRRLFAIAAGPASNLVLAGACFVLEFQVGAAVNLALAFFNLLPVGNLDGRRLLVEFVRWQRSAS